MATSHWQWQQPAFTNNNNQSGAIITVLSLAVLIMAATPPPWRFVVDDVVVVVVVVVVVGVVDVVDVATSHGGLARGSHSTGSCPNIVVLLLFEKIMAIATSGCWMAFRTGESILDGRMDRIDEWTSTHSLHNNNKNKSERRHVCGVMHLLLLTLLLHGGFTTVHSIIMDNNDHNNHVGPPRM
jgi:hypothetical protein